jgi:hypothetical protein
VAAGQELQAPVEATWERDFDRHQSNRERVAASGDDAIHPGACVKERSMRRFVLPMVALGIFCVWTVASHAQEEAKAILDKAIKAHGGEDVLAKSLAGRIKSKGKIDILGGIEFTQESAFMLPDKLRDSMEMEVMGQKIATLTLMNGDKISLKANGQDVPLDDNLKAEFKSVSQMLAVGRLVGLKDKKFELSPVGEVKVEGKPALGLRISAKGMNDITMFFDKDSGLMVKLDRRGVDPMTGQEFAEERIVQEYVKVDELPVPKRILVNRDGKKFLEAEILEMKFLEKIDENEFTNP